MYGIWEAMIVALPAMEPEQIFTIKKEEQQCIVEDQRPGQEQSRLCIQVIGDMQVVVHHQYVILQRYTIGIINQHVTQQVGYIIVLIINGL